MAFDVLSQIINKENTYGKILPLPIENIKVKSGKRGLFYIIWLLKTTYSIKFLDSSN
jgi:hypothetical protein